MGRLYLLLWFYWRRQWQPTPVLLPGKSHGRRSLVGCNSWGHEESDMTERLHFHLSLSCTGEGNGSPLQGSCLENPRDGGAWRAAVHGVAKSQIWLSDFPFTCHFHALEKEMAAHSSVLAWRIPGTGEPGGLPSLGSHRVGHDWSDLAVVVGLLHCSKRCDSFQNLEGTWFACALLQLSTFYVYLPSGPCRALMSPFMGPKSTRLKSVVTFKERKVN